MINSARAWLVLLFPFVVSAVSAQNFWIWHNPQPSGSTCRDVTFLDDQTGLIVTDAEILRTANQGATWSVVWNAGGRAIDFYDGIIITVGDYGKIHKSTDGGVSWIDLPSGTSDNLHSVHIFSRDSIYATGPHDLYRSFDGGVTWSGHDIHDSASMVNPSVTRSFFLNGKIGHAACVNGTILKTTDGGLTWRSTLQSNVIPSDFLTITFVNDTLGFATRQHNYVYETTDAGETWHESESPVDAIYDIFFVNKDVGYTTGEYGAVHKTEDGGASWEWAGFLDGRYDASSMFGLYFFDENKGFAVGFRGRIMKTQDGGQTWEPYALTYNNINDIIFPSSSIGYALGDRVYKTSDQGNTWTPLNNDKVDETWYYQRGYFLSDLKGFVTASNYYGTRILRTDDGGETWTDTSAPGTVLSFVDDQNGFCGGNGIYKTANGGTDWQYVSSFSCSDLHFIDELRGFAIRYGDLYKTADGGKNWTLSYEADGYCTQIDFVNDSVGYVSAEYGIVLKTTDGGETWEEKATDYDHLLTVDFITENIGFVSGEYGSHFSTADGGNTWTKYSIPAQVRSISLTSDNRCFVGGLYGALLSRSFTYPDFSLKALAAENVTGNAALLKGVVASNAASVDNIRLRYGINATFVNSIDLTPASVENGKNWLFSATLAELTPDTTYSFMLSATVNGEEQASNVVQFKTLPALTLSTPVVSSLKTTSARVSVRVTSNTNEITGLQFEYDTLASFATKVVVDADPPQVAAGTSKFVELALTDLDPNKQYYVRLNATQNGIVYTTANKSFTTLPEYEISFREPVVSGMQITLRAQVRSNDHAISELKFEWGLSRSFDQAQAATPSGVNGESVTQISASIEIPYADSIYFYRLSGNYNGQQFVSHEAVFRLSGGIIVLANPAENVTASGATLKGLVSLQGSYLWDLDFEYGLTSAFGITVHAVRPFPYYDTFTVRTALDSLSEDTEYFYRLKATLYDATIQYSETRTFRTGVITGIDAAEGDNFVSIYPNPAAEILTITSPYLLTNVEVRDVVGRRLVYITPQNFTCSLDVSGFLPGIYYVSIESGGRAITRKLVTN
jgi:photosystem II stability/assembly factor-like uncharacterized protein